MNEKALIKRCQRGERQAFDELIRLYYDYVSGFLLKNTADETLSEDLTQETFLKMIRSIEKFDPGGSAAFGTWLITIAKNCYIDHLRKNRMAVCPRMRGGAECRPSVLLLLRRAAWHQVPRLRLQGRPEGQLLPPLRQENLIYFHSIGLRNTEVDFFVPTFCRTVRVTG